MFFWRAISHPFAFPFSKRFLAVLGIFGLALPMLSACGTYKGAQDLSVGNCFNADNATLLDSQPASQIQVVECASKHNSEVIGNHKLDYPEYPGLTELAEQARILCSKDFASYVGKPFDQSKWDVYPLIPTETSWKKGKERTLTCVALTIPEISKSIKESLK